MIVVSQKLNLILHSVSLIGHHHLKNILRHKIQKHETDKKVKAKAEDKPEDKTGGNYKKTQTSCYLVLRKDRKKTIDLNYFNYFIILFIHSSRYVLNVNHH